MRESDYGYDPPDESEFDKDKERRDSVALDNRWKEDRRMADYDEDGVSAQEWVADQEAWDRFAAAAMQGQLSAGVLPESDKDAKALAVLYANQADAMMAERAKRMRKP